MSDLVYVMDSGLADGHDERTVDHVAVPEHVPEADAVRLLNLATSEYGRQKAVGVIYDARWFGAGAVTPLREWFNSYPLLWAVSPSDRDYYLARAVRPHDDAHTREWRAFRARQELARYDDLWAAVTPALASCLLPPEGGALFASDHSAREGALVLEALKARAAER